jgi:hypothetical protein
MRVQEVLEACGYENPPSDALLIPSILPKRVADLPHLSTIPTVQKFVEAWAIGHSTVKRDE